MDYCVFAYIDVYWDGCFPQASISPTVADRGRPDNPNIALHNNNNAQMPIIVTWSCAMRIANFTVGHSTEKCNVGSMACLRRCTKKSSTVLYVANLLLLCVVVYIE